MRLPLVVVVVEGDMETLDHASALLKKGIPIIVVKGSGKAADFIANCMDEYMYVNIYRNFRKKKRCNVKLVSLELSLK